MATAYTSLLGLALPVTGELSGSWGDIVNDSITSLLDSAISGTTSLTTDADVTLTTTTGAANQARQSIILWNPASGSTTRNITAPAQSKIYTVINASGGTQSIVFRGAGPTTGVTIIKGESAVVAWNGSDFIKISNTGGGGSFTNVTISGTTTLSGLTASTALALNASKEVVSVTNTGTGNNVLATSPTLVTPALGTPSSATLTNATGLPISTGVSGLGTGVATFLGTPSSANLAAAVTDETGSGALVFATSPTLVTPALGTPASATLTNATGLPLTTGVTGTLPTANGGTNLTSFTANGVVYASSSSALATGSALTFDGTSLGVGVASPTQLIDGTAANPRLKLTATSTGYAASQFVNSSGSSYFGRDSSAGGFFGIANGTVVYSSTNDPIGFYLGGSEQMRLTSTGLGIGTSSPTQRLEVRTDTDKITQFMSGTGTAVQWQTINDAKNANVPLAISTLETYFLTGGSERMRLDSSGNLGIGTSSPIGRLEVVGSTGGSFNGWFRTGDATAANNAGGGFYNTSSATATSRSAIMALDADGANLSGGDYFIIQKNGNSGTADILQYSNAAIRFGANYTNRAAIDLTLDSSGNLGLGVTPSAWGIGKGFEIGAVGNGVWAGSGYLNLMRNTAFTSGAYRYVATSTAARYEIEGNVFKWLTAPSGTAGNAITFTQAMTLDASGNLGVGTTSPANRLHVAGATTTQLQVQMSGQADMRIISDTGYGALSLESAMPLIFRTNAAERARITSGGDLLVGTTSSSGYHRLNKSNTSDWICAFTNDSATTPWGVIVSYSAAAPNNTSPAIGFGDTGGERATIRNNGGFANYSANDVNLSDRREKTNFAPAKSYLDTICAIPVQTFNYIDQNLEEDAGLTLGVVAQDVQAVAPELVMESNWGTQDEPKTRLSIYQTDLQYALMKCIQEQQALITALTARVAALEAA